MKHRISSEDLGKKNEIKLQSARGSGLKFFQKHTSDANKLYRFGQFVVFLGDHAPHAWTSHSLALLRGTACDVVWIAIEINQVILPHFVAIEGPLNILYLSSWAKVLGAIFNAANAHVSSF